MIRVMITDDHLIIREGLRLILETADGIELVGEAKDGAECLELVKTLNPQVILMDLQMPRMDGITAIEHLRKDYPEIAIVILTTYKLGITERTVKAHLQSVYQKFGVDSRAAAVAIGAQKGLLGE